ncbi:MAG: universal stress protein [Saccharolobus sp.]|uniref:UspA stress protein-like protein n=1 Tax=Saccharolobus shibatae (strain ATCC 51178 / DSM 5389 / JCM 8931 / NBRC 15437 / B12) TaxID=523848 RepID=A0A8F5BRG1_SACSH|nr:universal stress protein [Saccharolobus shibatae]MCH4814766.1 universal stress protein [Saccharolobus shibatae]QXJ29966.1 UspA stress protein-like protein [Saccharolobus shibatae B12]
MSEPSYFVSFWLRKILVPVDGSENSLRALDLAVDFGMRYGSKITIIHICSDCSNTNDIQSLIEKRVNNKIEYDLKIVKINIKESSVSNEILKVINEEPYDAVIMGARGTSLNSDINIGSTALAISINAPVSVILVR